MDEDLDEEEYLNSGEDFNPDSSLVICEFEDVDVRHVVCDTFRFVSILRDRLSQIIGSYRPVFSR